MAGRVVERGEVVVVELDLGTFHHPVAEADEDVLELAAGLGQQVQVADRGRRRPRQGDVERVAGDARLELGGLERLRARSDLLLESLLGLVGAGPDRPALFCRQLADPAQDRGQLRLAPEIPDPQLLERSAVRGGVDRRLGLFA
jgi:hypothetical protein